MFFTSKETEFPKTCCGLNSVFNDQLSHPGSESVTDKNGCHGIPAVSDPPIRFLCDAMLGRLARYLRLLGYDTAYRPVRSRHPIEWAIREHRFLLTRDTTFVSECIRNGQVGWYNPDHNDPLIQLQRTICKCNLIIEIETSRPRCVRCNRTLESIQKSDVDGEIPDYAMHHATSFLHCPECGRYYWNGTHHNHFVSRITHQTS